MPHVDANGFGTGVHLYCGEKLWFLLLPKRPSETESDERVHIDHQMFKNIEAIKKHFDVVAIHLQPGMELSVSCTRAA